jgi:hypothetical protein
MTERSNLLDCIRPIRPYGCRSRVLINLFANAQRDDGTKYNKYGRTPVDRAHGPDTRKNLPPSLIKTTLDDAGVKRS